jgi:hypothetical protein
MDIKAMAGTFKGYYRLRIGSYRVLFVVDQTAQTIYVDHIGSRGDVYRYHRSGLNLNPARLLLSMPVVIAWAARDALFGACSEPYLKGSFRCK